MSRLSRSLKSDELFLILLCKPGQNIARGRGHCPSRKVAALGGIVTETLERLLFHEVATHLR